MVEWLGGGMQNLQRFKSASDLNLLIDNNMIVSAVEQVDVKGLGYHFYNFGIPTITTIFVFFIDYIAFGR